MQMQQSISSAGRSLDILCAVILAPIWLPLMTIGVILLVLENPRLPTIFMQVRLGYDQKQFTILKLRTMLPDGQTVTTVGRWLRKTHLDELPQFLNVLCGHMRIVGPRPLTPEDCQKFRSLYGEAFDLRFRLYPGITGEEQLLGRERQQAETVHCTEVLVEKMAAYEGRETWMQVYYIGRTIGCMIKRNGSPA